MHLPIGQHGISNPRVLVGTLFQPTKGPLRTIDGAKLRLEAARLPCKPSPAEATKWTRASLLIGLRSFRKALF